MNLITLSKKLISPQMVGILAREYDLDNEQTQILIRWVMDALLIGLVKNVETEVGAEALEEALEADHDGELLEELAPYFQGKEVESNQDTLNSEGILEHILGSRISEIVEFLSEELDLAPSLIQKFFHLFAPVVLAILSKVKRETWADAHLLADILRATLKKEKALKEESIFIHLLEFRE